MRENCYLYGLCYVTGASTLDKSRNADENPASILSQDTKDSIFKHELFSAAREILEITRRPMEKLNLLERKATRKLICLKATLA